MISIEGASRPRFSLIVPAHNEERRIERMLTEYARVFADSEIIVVLNGCVDRTREIVERIRDRSPQVHIVEIPDAIGKGGAVRAGFLLAQADIVGYVDADGSTPPAEMRRLFEALGTSDAVIGSRWLPGSRVEVEQPLKRRIASRCFNVLVRGLFGLKFADTQCGAKVFRADKLRAVMPHVETTNLAFDVDLLFEMSKEGMSVKEDPTHWIDTDGSTVRLLSASARMFASIVRMRLRRSLLRLAVPLFDSWFPTSPLKLRDSLRILVINWRDPKHPNAGGAEAYLFEQARFWVRWGHHVEWLTANFPGGTPTDEIDGIRVRRVGNAQTVYAAVPLTYLREFRDRFDVIVDSSNGIPFFTPLYSLKPKVCTVYHVHQDVFKKHLPALLAIPLMWCEATLVPWLYRRSRFVTISDDSRNDMLDLGVGAHHLGMVRCGVDPWLVPGVKAQVPTVTYLGRLKAYKRVDLVIDAFARVRKAVPNAVLRIAGAGDARTALEALTAELGLQDCVYFEGFIDDARKLALLQESWVTVSASETEGWGISVIESNACGTPAVSFDVPGLSEAIVDGLSGLVVPEGSDLAKPLIRVLLDDALRAGLCAGALVRAGEFSWESAAREMLNQLVQAMVGGEIRAVDLDERWFLVQTYFGSTRNSFVLNNRERFMSRPALEPTASRH